MRGNRLFAFFALLPSADKAFSKKLTSDFA